MPSLRSTRKTLAFCGRSDPSNYGEPSARGNFVKPGFMTTRAKMVSIGIYCLAEVLSWHVQAQTPVISSSPRTNENTPSRAISNLTVDGSALTEFEQAKRTFKGFRVESVDEFIRIKKCREEILSHGKITHKFTK